MHVAFHILFYCVFFFPPHNETPNTKQSKPLSHFAKVQEKKQRQTDETKKGSKLIFGIQKSLSELNSMMCALYFCDVNKEKNLGMFALIM